MRSTVGERQPDREMTGATLHRERHEKLLSTLTGGVAFRMTQPALQSHPFQDSLLNFYWIWNVQGWGSFAFSFLSDFFSPSLLSACGRVCHTTGEQPQMVNADKINFLMLIPLEAEHTEGGKRGISQAHCWTGCVSTLPLRPGSSASYFQNSLDWPETLIDVLTRLPGNVIIFKSRGNPYKITLDDRLIKLLPARRQKPLFPPFESGGGNFFCWDLYLIVSIWQCERLLQNIMGFF